MRAQRGQVAAELMGMLLIVAAIVAAVIAGVPGKVAGGTLHAVCRITAQDCGGNTALGDSSVDSDRDGVPVPRDPVPSAGDIDHDGLDDGEEIALGTDPRNPDSDGDKIPDGREYQDGTDPTKGVLPLTDENRFKPWERVGLTPDQWGDLEKAILDQVNPGGIKGFLLGNPYYGVTLDEDGNIELLAYQENGIPVRGLLELLGVAGEEGGAAAITRALAKLPTAAREALTARGLLPSVIKSVKPPVPPPTAGTAFNELDSL